MLRYITIPRNSVQSIVLAIFSAFSVMVAKQNLCLFQLNDISAIQANLSQQHALLTNLVKSGLPAVIADPDHDNRCVY